MLKPMVRLSSAGPQTKDRTEELKFALFLSNRKVTAISEVMNQALLLNEKDRKKWAKKFAPQISEQLDIFLDETMSLFDGVALDRELMTMFAQFTKNLKDVTTQVQGVIGLDQPIEA